MRALSLLPLWAAACIADSAPAPTWEGDVSARLARSCLPCHATGDEHRPALGTPALARAEAARMLAAVESGAMPPGGIDRSGACGTFVGPAPFTDEDAAVLRAWVEAGAHVEDGAPPPPDPPMDAGPRFDRSVDLLLPVSPEPDDAHRCFLVDAAEIDAPTHLAGVSVPSAGPLHHAMVFALPPASEPAVQALDDAEPGPGWSCPATPLGGSTLLYAWVPGSATTGYPDGAGAAVPAGPLVVQLHEHGPSDALAVGLSLLLVDEVEHTVAPYPAAASGFVLPAGEERVELERSFPLASPTDVQVLGVMPHLHQAGRSASLHAEGGPCLVDAPGFDFGWQQIAFYEEPLPLPAGAPLTLSCAWDTRGRTGPIPWGESSDDEMCTVFLFLTADR